MSVAEKSLETRALRSGPVRQPWFTLGPIWQTGGHRVLIFESALVALVLAGDQLGPAIDLMT